MLMSFSKRRGGQHEYISQAMKLESNLRENFIITGF